MVAGSGRSRRRSRWSGHLPSGARASATESCRSRISAAVRRKPFLLAMVNLISSPACGALEHFLDARFRAPRDDSRRQTGCLVFASGTECRFFARRLGALFGHSTNRTCAKMFVPLSEWRNCSNAAGLVIRIAGEIFMCCHHLGSLAGVGLAGRSEPRKRWCCRSGRCLGSIKFTICVSSAGLSSFNEPSYYYLELSAAPGRYRKFTRKLMSQFQREAYGPYHYVFDSRLAQPRRNCFPRAVGRINSFRFLCALARRRSLGARPKICVVFGGSAVVTPLVVILARVFGRRAVVQIHGLDVIYRSAIYQMLCVRWLKLCDQVVANSRCTAQLGQPRESYESGPR